MQEKMQTDIILLEQGKSPDDETLIEQLSVGIQFITDFWNEKYLNQYLALGGSKIKFVTGGSGSGKSHLLKLFTKNAKKSNYITINFSANDIWLHDFKEIYLEIIKRSNFMQCVKKCAEKIIIDLGYDPQLINEENYGKDCENKEITLVDYLSNKGELDPITKREIRIQLQKMFLNNPLIDNNFALAASLLTGGILGHPTLEPQNQSLLLGWLMGESDIKLSALRKLGLSPNKITKFNARHMLRSLCEIIRISGFNGVIVTIDNLEILTSKDSSNKIKYTKTKRDDVYESMRELIDEIDTMKNIMFVYAFDRELIDNELAGLKSYVALWNRIQNEIISNRFNKFTDIVDLEKLMEQVYTKDIILEMSSRLAYAINEYNKNNNADYFHISAISEEQISDIISKVKYTKICLPRLVNVVTLKKELINE